MSEIRVPVIVVGGGGCGLVSSTMLSNMGIEHVLVEAHTGTSHLPKASYLNQRTAEILDQHGLWKRIASVGCPPELMKNYRFITSLGGDDPCDAFVIDTLPCYGCNNDGPEVDTNFLTYQRDSPCRPCNLPQIVLEPILKEEAEQRNPGKILFNHRMVAFKEYEDYVVVEVINGATGDRIKYLADYMIAADGGKTVGPSLGISYAGERNLADTTSLHIKADLSNYWTDGDLMCWIVGVQDEDDISMGSTNSLFSAEWSTIVMNGPTWGKKSEEWAFHLGQGKKQLPVELLTEDILKANIRRITKIPDLDIEILKISRWQIDGVHATQFQTKRIFLAGDAAHRHPPITGLGLNTAIGDAHNITWKLAAAVKGSLPPSLLQTYEMERMVVGKRVVDWALFAFMNIRAIDTAFGFLPGGKDVLPTNRKILQQLVSNTFSGETRRAAIRYAVKSQRVETAAHDLEIGSIYPTGAFVPDGSKSTPVDPRGFLYTPTARPGHRLPHAWLEQGSSRISTHHLLGNQGGWALITDGSDAGRQWIDVVTKLEKQHGLRIKVARVDKGCDFLDVDGQWMETAGVKPSKGGAVLVRPDAYVALRAPEYSAEKVAQLERFFSITQEFRVQ
ncbi:uncharacterized protein PAC_07743 [Phialocephala subalpina]|uniref:FAD-binding domain-containing protein n=1 Tax=Phialocephala subalpina TaxID=576137 RepID=A0A1L7WYK8_9HELO|nr:uncharacterized protein PAC_07743 [Phialocephala subalpina]